MNKYYVSAITDNGYIGWYCELNYEIDSEENIRSVLKMLEDEGKTNPVILFFKKLNE